MKIYQINTLVRAEVNRFIGFPFELYKNHPLWVPPLLGGMHTALNRNAHPSYQHADAAFFVAESEGSLVARVGVIHNHRHNAYTKTRKAFFSFFEAADDPAAVTQLFDKAFGWVKSQGLDMVIGPRGLIGSDASGVLVEGFEYPPALNVPYNYPYYDKLLAGLGFEKDTQHYSGYIDLEAYNFPTRVFEMTEKIKKRSRFEIKSFLSMKELLEWAPRALEVHQKSFTNNHEYYPPTPEESRLIVNDLMSVADPRLIKLIMHQKEVVGFILAYPDINDGIRKAGGRLWPFGWYQIMQSKKQTRRVDVNGLGILPEYRGMGSNALLYLELVKTLKDLGYQHLEAVMVDEKNFRSKADNLTMGVTFYKTHRCYELKI